MQPEDQITLARERTAMAGERNRLANERTFSAWTRTGLASVGGGVAIIRLLSFHSPTHLLIARSIGCLLILLGIAIFIMAYRDFRRSHYKLKVQAGLVGSPWAITIIVAILCLISITLLFISFTGTWT